MLDSGQLDTFDNFCNKFMKTQIRFYNKHNSTNIYYNSHMSAVSFTNWEKMESLINEFENWIKGIFGNMNIACNFKEGRLETTRKKEVYDEDPCCQ